MLTYRLKALKVLVIASIYVTYIPNDGRANPSGHVTRVNTVSICSSPISILVHWDPSNAYLFLILSLPNLLDLFLIQQGHG